jgi:acyl-CoA synthetase (AMP-forming)/AMP-acid ligase II
VLRPTITPSSTRATRYRRPGGPWSVPPLDAALAPGTSPELDTRIAAVAGGLRRRGVGRGDVVAWQLANGIDALVLYRACWRLGAVAAPVHHQAGPADVDAALAQVSPALVVDDPAALLDGGSPVPAAAAAARPTDLAVALFTSGSTGTPKAVLHSHRGLAWKARLMARVHGVTAADTILMPAPLPHVSGLLNGVLVPGASGMRVLLMPKWDPGQALDVIERERVTFMIGPPTFFVSLLGAPGFRRERVRSLRLVSSGGAGVTPAFVDEAAASLGALVKRTYGSTEAPTITTSWAGDPPDKARDTDGRPTGEVELRLDPAGGGELLVRGPELFVGYADPGQTRAAHARGGWFRTGDLARISDDGWLTIVGRLKDIIIRGGENVAAAEVESVLEAHPDVRQAVAVSQPDRRLGERVVAFVVCRPGTDFDLAVCQAWFADRGVTKFKWPERVVVLDDLPLLAAGKPDKAALRARL